MKKLSDNLSSSLELNIALVLHVFVEKDRFHISLVCESFLVAIYIDLFSVSLFYILRLEYGCLCVLHLKDATLRSVQFLI